MNLYKDRPTTNKFFAVFRIWIGVGTILLFASLPVSSVMKQLYGGNVKISEDLTAGLTNIHLFEAGEETLQPTAGFRYVIRENNLQVDLSNLPADRITEIERAVANMEQTTDPCHWILDYPYFYHEHENRMTIDNDRLKFTAPEPDFLHLLAQSSCLIPGRVSFLMPFTRTQFGYEANPNALSGRPFLDSISPVAVDPLNPYLAFKLNEVDAFSVPEEKFRQISADEQIQMLPGPEYFLFLKSENLSVQQMSQVTSAIDLNEIARAVLNDHAQIYLEAQKNSNPGVEIKKDLVYLKIPEDLPYRLIGERLAIQLQNRGFAISRKALPKTAPMLELMVRQVREPDIDLFRYRLLRDEFRSTANVPWFEEWDQLQASARLIPLMLYGSRIAVRKNIAGLRRGVDGMPDFSNAWILPAP